MTPPTPAPILRNKDWRWQYAGRKQFARVLFPLWRPPDTPCLAHTHTTPERPVQCPAILQQFHSGTTHTDMHIFRLSLPHTHAHPHKQATAFCQIGWSQLHSSCQPSHLPFIPPLLERTEDLRPDPYLSDEQTHTHKLTEEFRGHQVKKMKNDADGLWVQ